MNASLVCAAYLLPFLINSPCRLKKKKTLLAKAKNDMCVKVYYLQERMKKCIGKTSLNIFLLHFVFFYSSLFFKMKLHICINEKKSAMKFYIFSTISYPFVLNTF